MQKPHKLLTYKVCVFVSEPDWIRTNDPKLRRFVLYPAELPVHKMEPQNNVKNACEPRINELANYGLADYALPIR